MPPISSDHSHGSKVPQVKRCLPRYDHGFRRSLSVTSAALTSRLSFKENAIMERLFMEHGATMIPSVLKDPLERGEERSSCESLGLQGLPPAGAATKVSTAMVMRAALVKMRWVSTPEQAFSTSQDSYTIDHAAGAADSDHDPFQ